MDKRLEANMRFLCDESRMLTGITVAYGTTTYSEWAQYGRAQEIDRDGKRLHSRCSPAYSRYDL